jgi:hypothetical protein
MDSLRRRSHGTARVLQGPFEALVGLLCDEVTPSHVVGAGEISSVASRTSRMCGGATSKPRPVGERRRESVLRGDRRAGAG